MEGNATLAFSTPHEFNIPYAVCEVVVAVVAVVGNLLVILAFRRERRLRRRTNYYIVSLASADLLVGLLGIPCALLAYVGQPTQKQACLFTVSLLVVLCTISIFCLVAVSVDRYWAILHPMGYSRNVRTKTAIGIICACWVAGSSVGFLPLMGWNNLPPDISKGCYFEQVMAPGYLVFLYFATIIGPATVMAAFYTHIYTVVLKQLKQMVTVNGRSGGTHGSMLRVLGAARKREVKATQNLSIIVFFFMVCWIPLYTINFFQSLSSWQAPETVTMCCIILSHLNSAGNPLLYAYHLRDFRNALRSLLFGPAVEKVVGRYNTAYPETPTELRERVKRANSVSSLYRAPANGGGNAAVTNRGGRYGTLPVGNVLRGHRRSMTVPLYHTDGEIYKITGDTYKLPQALLEFNLSCIMENSHSDEASRSLSVLGLQVTQTTLDLQSVTPTRADPLDTPLSSMVYMDDRTHGIYALGLVESPEVNGTVYNVADVEDLGVGSEETKKY